MSVFSAARLFHLPRWHAPRLLSKINAFHLVSLVTDKRTVTPHAVFQSLPSEIEVKYKIAECYTILKLDKDAIAVLDGIPSRQRTPKVGHYSHSYCSIPFSSCFMGLFIIQALIPANSEVLQCWSRASIVRDQSQHLNVQRAHVDIKTKVRAGRVMMCVGMCL